jgi:site-specific DNA-cytosine methylase
MTDRRFSSVEICAGLGGQALGLDQAGFGPMLLLDSNDDVCKTLALNRPGWNVRCLDLLSYEALEAVEAAVPFDRGLDLLSGGLPRVTSAARVARGDDAEERKILHRAVRMAKLVRPRAILLENLDALVTGPQFAQDRDWVEGELGDAGYRVVWAVLDASWFGVPQLRKSGFMVGLSSRVIGEFRWPEPSVDPPPTVGQTLYASMAARGWPGARRWAMECATRPGPALVGGSDRRGGADLGPSGSKRAWLNSAGINGNSLGDDVPGPEFPEDGTPKITVRQAAMIQGIPGDWQIYGKKTASYRQVGHALPPPLARSVGFSLASALAG